MCGDPMSCYSRAFEYGAVLGSSKNWARPHPVDNATQPNPTSDWNVGVFGLLDQDKERNPEFAAWTAVFVRYCDGSSYSSDRPEAMLVDPSKFACNGQPCQGQPKPVWFRGRAIFEALFEDLLKTQGMGAATAVILSGTSAGGMGTYMHADRLRAMLPPAVKFAAVPDAGMFIDLPDFFGRRSFRASIAEAVSLWTGNSSRWFTNDRCLAAHTGEEFLCYLSQYSAPFIESPLFATNSMYDAAGLNIQKCPCAHNITLCNASTLAAVQAYRDEYLQVVRKAVLTSPANPANGAFLTACNQHEEICRSEDFEGIHISGTSMAMAITGWWRGLGSPGKQHEYVDVRWPNNPTCWTGPHLHGDC